MRFLFLAAAFVVILTTAVLGATSVGRGEEVLITASCFLNSVLAADNASINIVRVGDNVSFLNESPMSQLQNGVFGYNFTFTEDGNYLATETCNYPGGVRAQGVDEFMVGDNWTALLLFGFGGAAALFGWRRRSLTFLAGVLFSISAFLFGQNIYILMVLLLTGFVLVFRSFQMKPDK